MSRITEHMNTIDDAVEDNGVAILDLRDEFEDLADRVQDLEDEAADEDDDDSGGSGGSEAIVDGLSDLHAAIMLLLEVTAAASVLQHSGDLAGAFDVPVRAAAKRVLAGRMRYA